MRRRRRSGPLWLLFWAAVVLLSAPAIDILYAVWPWPDGPRGPAPIREAALAEHERVASMADGRVWRVIEAVRDGTYRVLWGWTGLDYLIRETSAAEGGASLNDGMRLLAGGARPVWEALYWGVMLRGMRFGVLAVSAPLFVVAAIGAVVDGIAAWWLRRTAAVRESGFIYHRAKLGLHLSVLALWLVYVLPPVPMDPATVIPPFVLLFALALRLSVTWFKKHL
ncbi:MAG TPA: DUF4400 domain-containing protein [Rhodospirillales bacterium]|nr:DUF4400 domain-containing protein [Rhodospirillales bacterium]